MQGISPPTFRCDPLMPAPSYRILIVDDNVAAARMLGLLLQQLGAHEVSYAHDGADAVEQAARQPFDLVLLDIGLPKLDGYEVARQLRQSPAPQPRLLVALTGYGDAEDRRKSLEAGFDEHLVKPLALDALERLLGTVGNR